MAVIIIIIIIIIIITHHQDFGPSVIICQVSMCRVAFGQLVCRRAYRAAMTFSNILIQSKCCPRKLLMILGVMILFMASDQGIYVAPPRIDALELFAGAHSVTNGFRNRGCSAISMDYSTQSTDDDLTTTRGFLRALAHIVNLAPDGMLWTAPPCSSWVWIGRSSTSRTRESPLGNTDHEKVHMANVLVSRVTLLMIAAIIMHNARVWAEQPSSSIMEFHPRWQQFNENLEGALHTIRFWMQPYGGTSPKLTLTYSNTDEDDMAELCKPLNPSIQCTACTATRCSKGVTGGPDLKSTQAYPEAFGDAIAGLHLRHIARAPCGDGVTSREALMRLDASDDPWDDACLEPILVALGLA